MYGNVLLFILHIMVLLKKIEIYNLSNYKSNIIIMDIDNQIVISSNICLLENIYKKCNELYGTYEITIHVYNLLDDLINTKWKNIIEKYYLQEKRIEIIYILISNQKKQIKKNEINDSILRDQNVLNKCIITCLLTNNDLVIMQQKIDSNIESIDSVEKYYSDGMYAKINSQLKSINKYNINIKKLKLKIEIKKLKN